MYEGFISRLREARAEELEGEGAGEAGFTLIELMVVLLIIAILLAIAIPTFLGVTSSANDRAAQSNLTNAVTEASAVYQANNQSFPAPSSTFSASNTDAYQSSAPEFLWASTDSTSQNQISVYPKSSSELILAVLSKTNTCWYIDMNETAGTTYAMFKNSGATACNAASTTLAPATPWTGGTSYGTAVTITTQ